MNYLDKNICPFCCDDGIDWVARSNFSVIPPHHGSETVETFQDYISAHFSEYMYFPFKDFSKTTTFATN